MNSRSAKGESPPGASADGHVPGARTADGSTSRSEWQLSARAFEAFLDALHPERDVSAERYERLRSKLIRFFEWRGCEFPDEHADETLTRVMRKLDERQPIQDVGTYCYGVARLVLLEARKQRRRQTEALAQLPAPAPLVNEADLERRVECLRTCMSALDVAHQQLIHDYHRHDTRERIASRQRLAGSLGIRLNALRIRVHRLTDRLAHCVRKCAAAREGVK